MTNTDPAPVPDKAPSPGRFEVLPPRVAVEDMVEEQPASTPGADTTPDANTEIAWRYGLSGGA